MFNKILEFLEFLEHLRLVFKQIDPCKFTKVINESNIVFISSNGITDRTSYIRKISSKGAMETLVDFG
jgi:hypothetical protein